MRKHVLILLLTICTSTSILDSAEAQQANRLDIDDAIALAKQNNPALKGARLQISLKKSEYWPALGIYPPELSYLREGISSTADPRFTEQRWSISQTLDFPLFSYHRLRKVQTEKDALEMGVVGKTVQLTGNVKKAYIDLLYLQEIRHLRQQEVRLAEQLLEAVELRVEVGESSELEQMKAEIQLAAAQTGLEDAGKQFDVARYALFSLVGIQAEQQTYDLSFADTLTYVRVDIDQAEVMARLGDQYEWQSTQLSVAAARRGVSQFRSAILPTITTQMYRQDYGTGYNQYGFQLGIQVPVFSNFRSNIRQAKVQVQTQQIRADETKLALKLELETAWHGYEASRLSIDRYVSSIKSRSEELIGLTLEGYRIGELELLELLDTQRTYLTVQERFYKDLRSYYYYLIELERFMGRDLVFNE
ncbi:MAG: TolC family protein [Rhodothermales bacterium]|nr:TolC family protein [Rhodothermales bacterium]